MKKFSSIALLLPAALATWTLLEFIAPPTASTKTVRVAHSAFLDTAPVLLAADGTCPTQLDVGGGVLGADARDATTMTSVEAQESSENAAADTVPSVIPGGSCGPLHLAGSNAMQEALDAEAEVGLADDLPTMPEQDEPQVEPQSAAPAPRKSRPRITTPPKDALTAWWPPQRPGALNILFVGEAAFGSAITVLTDGRFENAESANRHLKVEAMDGGTVSGRWLVATNPKMLLLGVEPGVYKISIEEGFADAQGRQSTPASGRVYVR